MVSRASSPNNSTTAALAAYERGYQAVPIRDGGKRPYGSAWTRQTWDDPQQVTEAFDGYRERGAGGIGLLLGEPSGGLIDVDLDHAMSLRLRDHFLPPSPMQTGRSGRPRSHRWYRVEENLPATRRYKMPDGSVSVELRSTGSQTVIPPSVHPSGEKYRWEGTSWGGRKGPAVVEGRKLAVQVALLGMGAVLLENWPKKGGRHEAYLALAGGLLRFGHDGVHPYWEKNLPLVIEVLADVTHDDDGAGTRVAEVMGSTITRLRENGRAIGFPKLAEMIGADHAELVRRMAREVESLSGFAEQPMTRMTGTSPAVTVESGGDDGDEDESIESTLPPEVRNPMEERISSWAAVDLEPYLTGEVVMPEPSVLVRSDGKALFYPGRVNSLYGKSESAKSWLALHACAQEIAKGERVVYIDFEDGPEGTLGRLLVQGVGADDLHNQFRYVHPEGPLAEMQRYRYGHQPTEDGTASSSVFRALLESFDPTLIVADGMTVLYGLHGHDTNEATATEVITGWLKRLCRGSRTTVVVIDHTGKSDGPGTSPIGSHHKVAMVQGTALRVETVDRPMPGQVGSVRLVVFKDRPGAVRKISSKDSEQVAGVVTIDSSLEDQTSIVVDPPQEGQVLIGGTEGQDRELASIAQREELGERILGLFGGDLDAKVTTVDVVDSLGVSRDEAYEAWRYLTERGIVTAFGETRWRHYRLNYDGEGEE